MVREEFIIIIILFFYVIMPERHIFYKGFITAIQNKITNRAILVNTITDLLEIDKDAVYRRLRGEVCFSFVEMAIIAKKLGISLDGIVGIETAQSKATYMNLTRHVNPSEIDYQLFNSYINFLKFIKDDPDSLLLESNNALPHNIYLDYEAFTRLVIFSWNQASSFGTSLPFHKIVIPDQMRFLQKECCKYSRHIKSTQYVWDRTIFQRLVENIRFASSIHVLAEEDVARLKFELMALLNHLERLAITGRHEETGNEVSIYISDLLIETNYTCIRSKTMFVSLFRIFQLNSNASHNEVVYNEVSHWIRSLQKMSTLISVSGEKIRTSFFNTQRKIIETL
jgi:hypothetical protein